MHKFTPLLHLATMHCVFEKVTQQRRACSLGSALGKEITLGTGLRPPDLLEVLIKSRIFMAPRSEIRPHLASHTVD